MPLPLLPQGTLDFTLLSREDMLTRMQTLANQVNPAWDDFSQAFPENILLELMAFSMDVIRGTVEERVRQLNWATISDPIAAVRLGKISGFQLSGASASQVTVTFTISGGTTATRRVPIPENTVARSSGKRFRVVETDKAIEIGQSSVDVLMEQSELVGPEVFEISPDEPNIELLLQGSPYIDDSVTVTAVDGTYTAVDTLTGQSSTARVYVPLVDDQGRLRLRFGNGISGAIPQGEVSVEYLVGGGTEGEVEASAPWTLEDAVSDEDSQPVLLTLSNVEASSAATDSMTVAEARVRGPLSLRTVSKRSVNEDDFEIAATSVSGIARALMATSETSEVVAEDNGILYAVAYGTELASGKFEPAAPTTAQLNEVSGIIAREGDQPLIMGVNVAVTAAPFKTVNVTVKIYKESGYTASTVSTNIREALKDLFAVSNDDRTPNTNMDFGARMLDVDGDADKLLDWSLVFNAVYDAEGVRRIPSTSDNLLLNGLHGSVSMQPQEFPELGAVTIIDMDQSGAQI